MKLKIIKIILSLVAIALIATSLLSYWNKIKADRLVEAKEQKVLSDELEQRAKFLNIKLGSDMNNYKGFRALTRVGPDFSEAETGSKVWGYFKKDEKYNHIGSFYLLDFIADAQLAGANIPVKETEGKIGLALRVYTFDNKIYRIEAIVKEYDTSFNELLRQVYGPAAYDNGYNDISYKSTDELTWESPSVTLTTRGTVEVGFTNGRVSGIPDRSRYIKYVYNPLLEKLYSIQSDAHRKELQSAEEQL